MCTQVAEYVPRSKCASRLRPALRTAGPLFADPRPSRTPHHRHGQRKSIPPRIIQQTSAPVDKIVFVRNRPLSHFQTRLTPIRQGGASTSKGGACNLVDGLYDLEPRHRLHLLDTPPTSPKQPSPRKQHSTSTSLSKHELSRQRQRQHQHQHQHQSHEPARSKHMPQR